MVLGDRTRQTNKYETYPPQKIIKKQSFCFCIMYIIVPAAYLTLDSAAAFIQPIRVTGNIFLPECQLPIFAGPLGALREMLVLLKRAGPG